MGRLMDVDALKEALDDGWRPDIMVSELWEIVDKQPTVNGWISVEDDLPKQHKSIFAPWYGTKMWNASMWKEESDTVIVAGRFPDGTKTTTTGRLQDGKWSTRIFRGLGFVVTHWMPMPKPPEEEYKDGNED